MNVPKSSYQPELGAGVHLGIGIVGAGAIVESAHLPAYRKNNFRVMGIFDISSSRASELAQRFSVAKVYLSLDELLDDPEVAIVDIAVTPSAQRSIAIAALKAGKHVLCQKPLADTFEAAKEIVAVAAQERRQLAVNENMRWDPAMRASRNLIRDGFIGTPLLATLEVNYWENWGAWPWLQVGERLTILFDAIHPIYSFRMLFGDPSSIYCATTRSPEQAEHGETIALLTMRYPEPLIGFILDSSRNPTTDHFATFRFDGTQGSIKGTLGIWYDYPVGRADTLGLCSKTDGGEQWVQTELEGRWVPDAFAGPMAALMAAVTTETEFENSGSEHLKTLRLVEAAYRSAADNRTVALTEIP